LSGGRKRNRSQAQDEPDAERGEPPLEPPAGARLMVVASDQLWVSPRKLPKESTRIQSVA